MKTDMPLGMNIFFGSHLVKKNESLSRFKRGSEVLFIEKETASFIILSGAQLEFFNSLRKPVSVSELRDGPPTCLSVKEKEELLLKLYERNMVTINGLSHLDPAVLWKLPQKYPGFLCFHITHSCNFRCKYCYALAEMSHDYMKKMPRDVYIRATEKILEELPIESYLIDFHGGEPFIAYDEMLEIINHARQHNEKRGLNKKLSFVCQSNGSLLTYEKIKNLYDLNCSVGISLDGPSHVHDKNRIFCNGMGTHEHIMSTVKPIMEQGYKMGYLAVVHDPENYIDVLKFFMDEGKDNVRINYSAFIGRAAEELEFPHERAEVFAKNYLKMVDFAFDYVLENKKQLVIKDLDSYLSNVHTKQRPYMCFRSPCGCGNSILGFGADGGIFACEEAVGIEAFRIGNVFDKTNLADMLDNSPVLKEIGGRNVDNIPRCKNCAFKRFCGGRCTTKSFAKYGNFRREDPMCRFYQVIFPEIIWKSHDRPEAIRYLNPRLSHLFPGEAPMPEACFCDD
jgi:radical SAM protein with 4Fe4S-binding SPASM domain